MVFFYHKVHFDGTKKKLLILSLGVYYFFCFILIHVLLDNKNSEKISIASDSGVKTRAPSWRT